MMYKKILVTGCGGDIGMSVGRILKEILPDATIVGSEISSDHPGQFVYDSCIVLPRVDAPEYLTRLKNAVREHAIECIIPMSVQKYFISTRLEFETLMEFLSSHRIKWRLTSDKTN